LILGGHDQLVDHADATGHPAKVAAGGHFVFVGADRSGEKNDPLRIGSRLDGTGPLTEILGKQIARLLLHRFQRPGCKGPNQVGLNLQPVNYREAGLLPGHFKGLLPNCLAGNLTQDFDDPVVDPGCQVKGKQLRVSHPGQFHQHSFQQVLS
jgi:hypothetical protein